MQDYIELAEKNGVTLLKKGKCQFCGANTKRGIHECLEIFNLGFQVIDYSIVDNHIYRFLIVDAHCLQHPEIHGRWSNHFHLTRLHLKFSYKLMWTYLLSIKLSEYINKYKLVNQNQPFHPPEPLERGEFTTTDVLNKSGNEIDAKKAITLWAEKVYEKWKIHHHNVDEISKGFLQKIN